MLAIHDLTRVYGDLVAVSHLSLSAASGEILGLVGPNGSGKTTTLRCCCGILEPTEGSISIDGYDLAGQPVEAKRRLAFVPDEPSLFDHLTVAEHLAFFGRLYATADAAQRAATLLEDLDLEAKRDSLPGELSRGMRQKLAVACGLVHDPRVLILDEPLTGLDPAAMRRMKDRFLQLARDGACILLSSHMLHLVQELATRLLILQHGRIVARGSLAEIVEAAQLGEDADLERAFLQVTEGRASESLPQP